MWEKVVRKLRAGTMPPQGAPRPDDAAQTALRHLARDDASTAASAARPNPGRPASASAQPRRVPERHPRSARARRRCRVAAAAPTIRATASTTSRTCWASRRRCSSATWARPRRSARWRSAIRRIAADRRDLSRALRPDADAPHRRPAARHARRHARSARRSRSTASTSSSRSSGAPTSDSSAGSRIRTRSRSRVDGERVHLVTVGTPEDFATSLMGPTERRDDHRAADAGARADQGRAAHDRRRLRREDGSDAPTLLRPYSSTLDPVDSDGRAAARGA